MLNNTGRMGLNSSPLLDSSAEQPELGIVAIAGDGTSPQDLEHVCHVVIDAPDLEDGEKRLLALARNGPAQTGNSIVDTYGLTDERPSTQGTNSRIMVVPNETFAIGYYLHLLEIHRLDEQHSRDEMKRSDADYAAYARWNSEQSLSDRRHALLDQMEQEIECGENRTKPVLERGKFRGSAADPDVAAPLVEEIDPNPKFCFKNALRIKRRHLKDDSIQYAEGVALSKHAARMAVHGWIEIDGQVVEPTWPWHSPSPPEETVYYGAAIDERTVATADIEQGRPQLLDIDDATVLG